MVIRCPECSYNARNHSALLEHRRIVHPGSQGANRQAVEQMIAELGDVDPKDLPRIEGIRSMADALDVDPLNAQMWKEYRASLDVLVPRGSNDNEEALGILQAISGAAKVAHAEET